MSANFFSPGGEVLRICIWYWGLRAVLCG